MELFTSNKICKRIKNLYGLEYKSDKDIDWGFLICYEVLSEDFIEEFIKYLKNDDRLDIVCKYQYLSESFIRRHKDEINWYEVSRCQILSPEFMEEFKDEIYWGEASLFQPFIDLNSPLIEENYYKGNILSRLYQKTKERGWFVGYLEPDCYEEKFFIINLDIFDFSNSPFKKVRIYWKDLIMTNRASKIELIREVKYV